MIVSDQLSDPDFGVLPEQILDLPRFLLWREVPHETRPNKTRKVPYYANGKARKGSLDSETDLSKLVTFREAIEAKKSGRFDGIGLALVGEGIGAFDIDYCLTETMELNPKHPGHKVALALEKAGCYMEISPSGRGLRALGPSSILEAFSKDQVEYWAKGRFVTLTGWLWANEGRWEPVEPIRARLKARPEPVDDLDDEDGPIITPKTISELREALKAVDADEYETWIRMGQALRTIGPKGRDLWLEWSATSDKFDEGIALGKWEGFRGDSTGFRAVFAEAQRQGWENPAKGRQEDEEDEGDDTFDDWAFPFDSFTPRPTEFILDGFLPSGVSVIAGAWGAGKSTNLIPLFCSVAHIDDEDWGFRPTLRRKVIWVTEAPEQARDTLFSIARATGRKQWGEIPEWFKLFRAKRRPARKLAKLIAELVESSTYKLPNGFVVNPVIVLDTTSANIDLENESDNSQVSAAMAEIKQRLPGIPIVLVGHTPKALVRGNVNDMTFRGAGAWEADAAATFFLVHDPDTGERFLALRKCRFSPDYFEVTFDHESFSLPVDTPWDEPQTKTFLHGVPAKSSPGERQARQDQAREERAQAREERQSTERQERVLAEVRRMVNAGTWPTKRGLEEAVPGRAEMTRGAISRLVEAGLLQEVHTTLEDRPDGARGPNPVLYLPNEVDVGLFLGRSTQNGTE